MGRRKKMPTKVVRLNINVLRKARFMAKLKGMSLPDYLAWRLSR